MTNSPQLKLNFSGEELKEAGMALAIESADKAAEKWSEQAYALLLDYIRLHGAGHTFQAEAARQHIHAKGLPLPPSNRAIGSLMVKLKNAGLIRSLGTAPVKNPRAHQANANVWQIV